MPSYILVIPTINAKGKAYINMSIENKFTIAPNKSWQPRKKFSSICYHYKTKFRELTRFNSIMVQG